MAESAIAGAPPGAARKRKISIRLGGAEGRLLHFFHGDYNFGGMSIKTVADAAGPGQPILAIAPHGFDGGPVPATIEQMAADRLVVVRQAQARGPYLLGGHCNGALVAFEIARLLVAAGERVDLVLMIDPAVVSARKRVHAFLTGIDRVQRLLGASEDARRSMRIWSWRQLVKLERWSYRRHLKAVGMHGKVLSKAGRESIAAAEAASQKEAVEQHAPGVSPNLARRLEGRARNAHYAHVLATYHPAPFDIPVLYFSLRYDGRAWKRISPQTELVELPAGHISFATDFAPAAERLRERLVQPPPR
jgi:thioesterase domain-containing protein